MSVSDYPIPALISQVLGGLLGISGTGADPGVYACE